MGQELLQASIVVQALGLGLRGVGSALASLPHERAKLGRMIAARDLLVPIALMSVLSILQAPREAIIGATMLAISPGVLLFPQRVLGRRSDSGMLFGSSALGVLSSIVTVPFWLPIVCWLLMSDASVAPTAVAQLVGVLFLLPLGLGAALRRLEPRLMDIASRPVIIAAEGLLWVALLPLLGDTITRLPQLGLGFIAAVICAPSIAVLVTVFTRISGGERSELTHMCSTRHPGLALLLAATNFAGENVLSAVVVSFIGGLAAAMLFTFLTRSARIGPATAIVPAIAIARDEPSTPPAPRSP